MSSPHKGSQHSESAAAADQFPATCGLGLAMAAADWLTVGLTQLWEMAAAAWYGLAVKASDWLTVSLA